MTLVEFLRARLDEDERRTEEAALDEAHWREREPGMVVTHRWTREALATDGEFGLRLLAGAPSPSRVLAEVEAKRRILVEHIGWPQSPSPTGMDCGTCLAYHSAFDDDLGMEDWPCRTVRLLALPYADHPDYREEWKP